MLLAKGERSWKEASSRILFALCCSDIFQLAGSCPIPYHPCEEPPVWGAMIRPVTPRVPFIQLPTNYGSFYSALWPCTTISHCVSVWGRQIAKNFEKWIHIGSVVVGSIQCGLAAGLVQLLWFGCWILKAASMPQKSLMLIVFEARTLTFAWLYRSSWDFFL
jgi:hypothetical protein